MNILFLAPSMDVATGGPPRVVAGSAAALAKRGHSAQIMALKGEASEAHDVLSSFPELDHAAIDIALFDRSTPKPLGASRGLQNAVADIIDTVDALHIHGVWEQCLAKAASTARKNNIPVFVSAHGMLDRWSMQQSRWKKSLVLQLSTGAMLRHADAIIYGTEDERQEGAQAIPGSRSAIVANGVDLQALALDKLPEHPALNTAFPNHARWKRTALFFSRIHPKKGVDILIEAFLTLAPKYPDAGLMIAGIAQDEEFERDIRQRIAASDHAAQIGLTTDLIGPAARAVFKVADIFVLPSHQEGFSIAILEAMALKKPVLITDKCHLPEVETSWCCGTVVPDDLDGITRGLDQLLGLPEAELLVRGKNARNAVAAHFSWDAIAQGLETLYEGNI